MLLPWIKFVIVRIFFFFFHLYYNSLYVSIESFSIFLFFFPHNNPYRVSLSGSNCAKIIRIKIALSKRNLYLYFKIFIFSFWSFKKSSTSWRNWIYHSSTIYHSSITLYLLLYHSSTISILSNSILLNSISNNELFAFFYKASISFSYSYKNIHDSIRSCIYI